MPNPNTYRPKVLLIAEAANPKLTSVALIGWQFARQLAEIADVHLVTELRNLKDIQETGKQAFRLTAINNRFWQGMAWSIANKLNKGSSLGWTTYTALSSLAYPMFERKVWAQFKQRLIAGEFDIVHRITPNSPVTPSYLAQKCRKINVPFILGPINGGVPWPKEFPGLHKAEKEWLAPFRNLVKLNPAYQATRKAASVILLGSKYAESDLASKFRPKSFILSENAVNADLFKPTAIQPVKLPLKAVFIGRLVPYKGADILIEAIAPLIRNQQVTLQIIGDGPEAPKLKRMAQELGLQIDFTGWVKQQDLPAELAKAQLFTFPSLHEFGGGVVLEAMASGLVPIIVNYGGPPELLPPNTGSLIPMGNRASIIQQLNAAISFYINNPEVIPAIQEKVRQHVINNFTWKAKTQQMIKIYQWAQGDTDKPTQTYEQP